MFPVWRDILVYRDTNHLTKTYALTVTPRFIRELEALGGAT